MNINGTMAEGLGRALQKLVQQFESVWYLQDPAKRDFLLYMLTPEEKAFIEYWAERRTGKKKSVRQFTIGLPLGVMIVLLLFVNVVTGWHKRAAMALQNNASLIIVILIAAIAIVIFMTIFARNHEWDQHETRYQELLQKQKESDSAAI